MWLKLEWLNVKVTHVEVEGEVIQARIIHDFKTKLGESKDEDIIIITFHFTLVSMSVNLKSFIVSRLTCTRVGIEITSR